jgi:hypothetical protein
MDQRLRHMMAMLGNRGVYSTEARDYALEHPDLDLNSTSPHFPGWGLMHSLCGNSGNLPVLKLLLSSPRTDVNVEMSGSTPIIVACTMRSDEFLKELIHHPRVDLDATDDASRSPLSYLVAYDRIDPIKEMIASGKEFATSDRDLAGEDISFAEFARFEDNHDIAALLERFESHPQATRHEVRAELGWPLDTACHLFACVVFVSDGLLRVRSTTDRQDQVARFFAISQRLPLELQTILCLCAAGCKEHRIATADSEVAFIHLASVVGQ